MATDVTAAKQAPPVMDGLPPERRQWAVAAIFAAIAMASLDSAIANIALPAIANDLHVRAADVVWVVNVYQIALVATLLPLGALGEIVGHERIYLGGLLLFTLASIGCACAWSLDSLLVARALQGLGASGVMSVNSALIRFIFPIRILGRGFGQNAMVVATAMTLGPTIASGILSIGSWPWLFAVNIPFGLIAIFIGLKTLPRPPRAVHAFDFLGAVLAAGSLGLFIIGIGSAAHEARLGLVAIELTAAILLGGLLMRRQADHPAPMLPIDLFRRPLFALSAGVAVCSFAVQGLAFVALPFYFEDILLRTPVETGFFMTPWPLVVAVMAPIGGRLSDRYPAGILWQYRIGVVVRGDGAVGVAPCGTRCRQYRLAYGALRIWFRLLSDAESSDADVECATRSQRKRERHRCDGAPDRTNHWRGTDGVVLRSRRPRRGHARAGARRGICCTWKRHEYPAVGRPAATRRLSAASSANRKPACPFFQRRVRAQAMQLRLV